MLLNLLIAFSALLLLLSVIKNYSVACLENVITGGFARLNFQDYAIPFFPDNRTDCNPAIFGKFALNKPLVFSHKKTVCKPAGKPLK